MNQRLLIIKRTLLLLAIGGSTFGLFGATFGAGFPDSGCNYALYGNYQTLYTAAGNAVITKVSDNYFDLGTDYNAIVKVPSTSFAQAIWTNWVDARVPDDIPNNPIVRR